MFFLSGDSEFVTRFDTNGSCESFELVTEENNADGGKKQEGTSGTQILLTNINDLSKWPSSHLSESLQQN